MGKMTFSLAASTEDSQHKHRGTMVVRPQRSLVDYRGLWLPAWAYVSDETDVLKTEPWLQRLVRPAYHWGYAGVPKRNAAMSLAAMFTFYTPRYLFASSQVVRNDLVRKLTSFLPRT